MTRSYSLADLAEMLGAELNGDPHYEISALATLQQAGASDLSFIANPAYQKFLSESQAGAVLIAPDLADEFSGNKLLVKNPYVAYARASALFDQAPAVIACVDPSAIIGKNVYLGCDVSIGANAVIGDGASLGDNVVVGAGVVVVVQREKRQVAQPVAMVRDALGRRKCYAPVAAFGRPPRQYVLHSDVLAIDRARVALR